ncbi:MAG: type II secretion system protein, partial [bacterium]|nr:type II secretion system protein [bacterium]
GFTLIELLVTISIFVIITGLVLVNSGQFNNAVILNNLAYEVALTLREAQSAALNVRQSGGDYNNGYGVHFDTSTDLLKKTFRYFSDSALTPLNVYSGAIVGSEHDDIIKGFDIKRGNYIVGYCFDNTGCPGGLSTGVLDVAFRRPDAKAYINQGGAVTNNSYVEIVLKSADGNDERRVIVQKYGQISVKE